MPWWLWAILLVFLAFGFVVVRGAPYVPSHRRFVRIAFTELYPLSKDDVLVDLGSGDGIVLRLAAEKGARAIGYELNPILVLLSRFLSREYPTVSTQTADFWRTEMPLKTTVVYAFSVSRDIPKLERKLQQTATACGHPVSLITYGAKLKNREPVKMVHAHALYVFTPEPLQQAEA